MTARLPDAASDRRQADEELAFWDKWAKELAEQYPDQYVAVHDGRVVAASDDLQKLLDAVKSQGLMAHQVRARFLSAQPASLVL